MPQDTKSLKTLKTAVRLVSQPILLIIQQGEFNLILFVVPRLHTNMLGWLKGLALLEDNYLVLVRTKTANEDYSLGESKLIDSNSIPYVLQLWHLLTPSKSFVLKKHISEIKPSLIILRLEMDFTSIILLLNVLISKKPFVIYQQWPIVNLGLVKRFIRYTLSKLLSVPFFSPVLSLSNDWIGNFDSLTSERQNVHFIPFAMPMTENLPRRSLEKSALKFVTIGKFQIRKNHLAAVETILDNPRFISSKSTLDIFGEASNDEHREVLKRLIDLIQRKKMESRVNVHVNIEHGKVMNVLRNYDVFFLLSESEPASISNVEAMGSGLTVIVLAGNGTANYLENNRGGFIVSGLQEFNEKITLILNDTTILSDFSIKNIEAIRKFNDPVTLAYKLSQWKDTL